MSVSEDPSGQAGPQVHPNEDPSPYDRHEVAEDNEYFREEALADAAAEVEEAAALSADAAANFERVLAENKEIAAAASEGFYPISAEDLLSEFVSNEGNLAQIAADEAAATAEGDAEDEAAAEDEES